ncbi:MAG: tetratricopeptide repeat protein [Microcoleus anatoxicus]|uniref:tetratricopeptide repeat protein n=1 Tax=Microcoleus anatoxicus TaxID=2705319 RepID=UPI00366D2749
MNVHFFLEEKPTRQEQKLNTLSKYVQKYPQGWKKRLELANLLYQMGNWQEAVAEYHQVIERQAQLMGVRLQLGKLLQLMKREKEAIEVYEKALSCSENEGTQHHINGLIAVCRGESEKAIVAFNLATHLEPEKVVHRLALAQVHQQIENPLGVLSAVEQILAINPDDVVTLIYSHDANLAVGDMSAATEQLSKLIALFPNDFRVLQRQIEQRLQMRLVSGEEGKLTKKMITSLLRQTPHGAEAHNSLGYYHIFRGDWRQGVEVLAEFTTQHPNYPYGWYYYGRCLYDTGEYQKAAQMMANAYQLYPDNCEIYRALCEILPLAVGKVSTPPTPPCQGGAKRTRGENSIKVPLFKGDLGGSPGNVVEEMLKRFPERWSVWATAGRVLVEHFKEIERGCSVSEQGTKLQPQLVDAWFRHGRVLALALKHQQAVEALEKGWKLLPAGISLQFVPTALWLAESYQVLGDVGASQRWWKVAGEGCQELRAFNGAMADYWLGRSLVGLKDRLGAIQAYESALSQQLLYPARGEVEKSLRRLKSKKGKGYKG